MLSRPAVCAALAALLVAATAPAAEFNMNVTVEGVTLGSHVCGPKVSTGDLKGKVVMLEFWGVNCGPCLAAMPHVNKLSEDYGALGLVVIGAHAQGGTAEKIKTVAQGRGATFAILENARVKDGDDFDGIPHTMVFDHEGKCVYRGHPMKVDAALKEAVGKGLAARFEGTPGKSVAGLLDGLKKGQAPAGILQKAIGLTKATDKDTVDQAKQLVAKMTEGADTALATIEATKADDPVAALPKLTKFSADFKGTPSGIKAAEQLAELKKDKAVMAEVKARPMLEKLKGVDELLTQALNGGEPNETFLQQQAGVLREVKKHIQGMKKSYPDAKSTQEAIAIGEKYGLKF